MSCEKCKKLFNYLVEEIISDCDQCEYIEYSTKAMSYVCNNENSEKHTIFFDNTYGGCSKHSEIERLEKEFGMCYEAIK